MSKPTDQAIAEGDPGKPAAAYEIPLGKTPPRPRTPIFAKPPDQPPKTATGTGDGGLRETVETIVFVAVLVLLLKTFLAEAFVIPTGSMATTLYGFHLEMRCEQCNYPNVTNASSEDGDPHLNGFWCANCQAYNRVSRGAP